MKQLQQPRLRGNWVQTERAAHEAWAALIRKSPLAAQVMHILTSQVGEHNAVVISQKTLARLVEASERGVRKSKSRWMARAAFSTIFLLNGFGVRLNMNAFTCMPSKRDRKRGQVLESGPASTMNAVLTLPMAEKPRI